MSSIDCILPESVGRLSAIFAGGGRISILAHTHPDGDALGSTGALVSYLKEKRGADALAIFSDAAPASLSFLCNGGDFIFADSDPQAALQRISHSDVIVLLDCNGFSRTEQLNGPLCESKAVKVLIDHHIDPERDSFDLVFSTEDISSTCELLFYILLEMDDIKGDARKLPSACARSLMAGMTTDTNNFANSVYPSTLRMASALLEEAEIGAVAIRDATEPVGSPAPEGTAGDLFVLVRRADGTLELGAYEKPAERVNADIYRHNYYYNGHKTTDEVYKVWVKPYEGAYQVTRLGELP